MTTAITVTISLLAFGLVISLARIILLRSDVALLEQSLNIWRQRHRDLSDAHTHAKLCVRRALVLLDSPADRLSSPFDDILRFAEDAAKDKEKED